LLHKCDLMKLISSYNIIVYRLKKINKTYSF